MVGTPPVSIDWSALANPILSYPAVGVKDLIIVDTPDALLIADRSRAQEVGDLVKRLEKVGREDLL